MLPEKSGLKYSGFESFKKFRAKYLQWNQVLLKLLNLCCIKNKAYSIRYLENLYYEVSRTASSQINHVSEIFQPNPNF